MIPLFQISSLFFSLSLTTRFRLWVWSSRKVLYLTLEEQGMLRAMAFELPNKEVIYVTLIYDTGTFPTGWVVDYAQGYAQGPREVLGWRAFSFGRGTPAHASAH